MKMIPFFSRRSTWIGGLAVLFLMLTGCQEISRKETVHYGGGGASPFSPAKPKR